MPNWPKIIPKQQKGRSAPKIDRLIWQKMRGFEFLAKNYAELTGDIGPAEDVTWENQTRFVNIYVQALAARMKTGELLYVPQSKKQPQFGHCETKADADAYIALDPENHFILIYEVWEGMALQKPVGLSH